MTMVDDRLIRQKIEDVYESESRSVLATLIRLLGDFDLAEDALHDAFAAAVRQWPGDGVPANPRAWLVSAGRFRAIDTLRRRKRFDAGKPEIEQQFVATTHQPDIFSEDAIDDVRLRLIFTCCHPALPQEARLALTLREVCGLTTEAIAHAFLVAPSTLAQRIVRAKSRIRSERIPYSVPELPDLPERLGAVLHVLYLIFNEGYHSSAGDSLTRPDLSQEAIRLARLLAELLPDPEVFGLLAMMLLHESRRLARATGDGDIIPLEEQDRGLWDRTLIREGLDLVQKALLTRRFGPYSIQAAIAAAHAEAESVEATNWRRIVSLYDVLLALDPSPIVELNRAVAVGMRDGSQAGLDAIESILDSGHLSEYHFTHAARADFCRRLGRTEEARAAYERALALVRQGPERRFLEKRMAEL